VSKNKQRTEKKLWTENAAGNAIQIYTAADEKDEARWVVEQINELLANDVSLDEIAVLYRTNAQSRSLEEETFWRIYSYCITRKTIRHCGGLLMCRGGGLGQKVWRS
jgi:DNA helicase-2/ATP-dependent DNA helicase PcrA